VALAGTGAIAIWNDITRDGRDDFYAWHVHEHIPERVAVPGFLRGSRYRAAAADTSPEFFTLYEIRDPGIATSAPYLARLNAPTDWTRRATAHFRNTSRALTRVVRSEGAGTGGALATARFPETDEGQAALRAAMAGTALLADIARLPRVAAAHLCATDSAASAARTAESRERSDIVAAPIGALMIEACDAAAAAAAMEVALRKLKIVGAGAVSGTYVLEYARAAG
jgi:hypothetical protein